MNAVNAPLEHHLRVELVDDAHRDWAAVRKQVERAGRLDRLMEHADGRLAARQAVVAVFLHGRVVAHACVSVRPARSPCGRVGVVAGLDSRSVDAPFAGTAVERVLMGLAHSRARTMGCPGIEPPPATRLAA